MVEEKKYKVSVIVPIYNVERFIGRCVKSLFEQTLKNVEYIFVDDATPDDSISKIKDLLNEYPGKIKCSYILKHEMNRGLPAARNTGLSIAKGEYIFHCDSDDFVEPDMLEKMWIRAKETDADIVWSDWFLSYGAKERYMLQPQFDSAEEALKGMLSGTMKYNVWNKLIKRELYINNHILFPEGHGMGEDMTIIRLFACARKVAYAQGAYYHYVKINSGAMTAAWSDRHLNDLKFNVSQTINFIYNKYGESLNTFLEYFKLNVKLPFLISDNITLYKLWDSWYAESNQYILQNKVICFRTRILQWMAWKKQYWYVWLYFKFVYQLVYSVILKYR